MGIALRNRLNGNKQDFLNDVRRFGRFDALNMWRERLDGYHDLIGLEKFLMEETHDRNFGEVNEINPLITSTGDIDCGKLMDSIAECIFKVKAANKQLREENAELKRIIAGYKIRNAGVLKTKLASILDACED